MPATDPEPEKYSIDDIMDRLRSRDGGSQDGEAKLVTREDGTQVYKMRKRKRRSHQPKKEKEQRQRRLHVGLIVVSVALMILLALAFVCSWFYLNSGSYRGQITEKIRVWTGAEPKLTELRVSPASAGAAGLELRWPADSILDELKLGVISGSIDATSLPKGIWKGTELLAAQGTLSLRPQAMVPGKADSSREDCPFQFRYRSNKFNVVMGNPEKPVFRVRDSEASLVPLEKGSAANLQLNGGYLDTAGWGNFQLEFASLQFEGGGMEIGSLRLVPASGGKAEIHIANPSGQPLDMSGEGTELELRFERVPLADLLGPACTWLATVVETPEGTPATPKVPPGKLLVRSAEKGGLSVRAPFRAVAATESTASGLPMFEVLSQQLRDAWYQSPRFDVVRGDVIKDREHAGVENLSLEARGRLTIQEGTVTAKPDGRLEGTLELGLPPAAVATAPAMRNLFTRQSGDLLWATVKISGTCRNPTDDLEARLAAPPAARAPGNKDKEDSFRELTTPEEK